MPNGADKKLNFVAKVYDPVAKEFKPIYIAPDATDKVQGDVKLSDATNSTLNASQGMTAATPAAVKAANDNANNKLDKTIPEAQTVAGQVTFNSLVTGNKGITVPSGQTFNGELNGNAASATKLKTPRAFSVSGVGAGNSVTFNGESDVTLVIGNIDASKVNQGTLPLSVVPKGALERVVHVTNEAARFQLTTSTVQLGDTVIQDDTGIMYIVVDESKLNEASGYEEYAAATAADALHADEADIAGKLAAARTIITNLASTSAESFDGTADITPGVTGILPISNGGTGATTAEGAEFNILGNPTASATAMTDATKLAMVFDAPDTTQGTLFTRTGSQLWTYIKDKTDSLYADIDHTHNVFTATENGFVPASGGGTTKFLRADGTWQVAGEVTGVKGDAENAYRTGNVNLTPANIGAASVDHVHNEYLPLAGGTLTGNLSSRQITPSSTNSYTLGTSSLQWSNVYATVFTGNLNGNAVTATSATTATTASRLNKILTLTGTVTGSVSLNADGTASLATTLANPEVVISDTQPTNSNARIWIKI